MFLNGFASGGITVPNVDTIVVIHEGDYVSHESLAAAFGDAIVAKLIFKVTGFTVANLTAIAKTKAFRNVTETSDATEQPLLGTTHNDVRLKVEVNCNAVSFDWGQPLKFQCLNIPTSTVYNLDNGSGAVGDKIETTQLFIDSYYIYF